MRLIMTFISLFFECNNAAQVLLAEYEISSFSSQKTMEVLPILHSQKYGNTELTPFTLTLKNPMKAIIELCLSLTTRETVLPVLITLMLHCERDNNSFQVRRKLLPELT